MDGSGWQLSSTLPGNVSPMLNIMPGTREHSTPQVMLAEKVIRTVALLFEDDHIEDMRAPRIPKRSHRPPLLGPV